MKLKDLQLLLILPFIFGFVTPEPPKIEDKSTYEYVKTLRNNLNKPQVVTTDPNGSINGEYGELITYNNAGTLSVYINTSSPEGTAWTPVIQTTEFPQGAIVMWSGSIVSIPSGWELSDGTCTITCPDLRDRFVMGAGSTYAVAATGGATTHTISVPEMPAHTHALNGSSGSGTSLKVDAGGVNPASDTSGSTGSGTAMSILNPYYALAYIIKI